MASSSITSWQMETVTVFFGLQNQKVVTAAMKLRHLLLGRKAMANLDSILQSRHYFADKGLSNQSYGFSVVMSGCES